MPMDVVESNIVALNLEGPHNDCTQNRPDATHSIKLAWNALLEKNIASFNDLNLNHNFANLV